jgi:hypothetical protein
MEILGLTEEAGWLAEAVTHFIYIQDDMGTILS